MVVSLFVQFLLICFVPHSLLLFWACCINESLITALTELSKGYQFLCLKIIALYIIQYKLETWWIHIPNLHKPCLCYFWILFFFNSVVNVNLNSRNSSTTAWSSYCTVAWYWYSNIKWLVQSWNEFRPTSKHCSISYNTFLSSEWYTSGFWQLWWFSCFISYYYNWFFCSCNSLMSLQECTWIVTY